MTQQTKPPELAGTGGRRIFKNESGNSITLPPIDKFLPRLEGVKATGPRKWVALCPSHPDRRPSLSIREVDDGAVLIKCWSGCGAADVVEAVGLRLHDLFPRRAENRPALRPGERWIPRDALAATAHAAAVIVMAAEAVARGEGLDRAALDQVARAAGRLKAAAREVGCHD